MSLDPLPLPPSRRDTEADPTVLRDQRDRAEAITQSIEEDNALLLRQRSEFRDRLVRAQVTLAEIARTCRGDAQRVEGKAQGIGLALSYLDEYLRGSQ